jgi:hypothetical protein
MSFNPHVSREGTGDIRKNLQLLAEQLNELERNPLFRKQAHKNLDVRLFVITRDSYADLNETLRGSATRRNTVSIRPLDAQHLINNKNKIDELVDRLVWFNENTRTVSIMPQKTKEDKGEIDIDLEVKQRGQPKSAQGTFMGPIKAHTVTKKELDEINQATIEVRVSLQLLAAQPTAASEGASTGILSPKILKQEAVRNPFERVFKTEEEKPASKRRKRVEGTKPSDKTQKNSAAKAEENRRLRKSGEEETEAFHKSMKRVDKNKELHRGRIADNAKKTNRR